MSCIDALSKRAFITFKQNSKKKNVSKDSQRNYDQSQHR